MSLICDYCGDPIEQGELRVNRDKEIVHRHCQFGDAQTPAEGRHI